MPDFDAGQTRRLQEVFRPEMASEPSRNEANPFSASAEIVMPQLTRCKPKIGRGTDR